MLAGLGSLITTFRRGLIALLPAVSLALVAATGTALAPGATNFQARLSAAVVPPSNPAADSTLPQGYAYGCSNNLNAASLAAPIMSVVTAPGGNGYWAAGSDGGIFAFGNAEYEGSMGGKPLSAPIVGMAQDPATGGYWLVAADGGVFAFDAPFLGSMGGKPLAAPIVGIASSPNGLGYWLVARDGGIFAFGKAGYAGSMGGKPLVAPITGMATDPATGGYWLVAADGGIFAFNAPFDGSMGGHRLVAPVMGMAEDPATGGYWLVASDGGIFAFDAPFDGSMGGQPLASPIVGMATTPDGGGYRMVGSDGGVFSMGDAGYMGSVPAALMDAVPPTQCDQLWLAAINQAHQAEGIAPFTLPSNWNALSAEQQLFIAFNLERTERGIAPFVGLSDVFDPDVQQGAEDGGDPTLDPSYDGYSATSQASIWAGAAPDEGVLHAVWSWMYDDGSGGTNLDCEASGEQGCWGHRDAILGADTGVNTGSTVIGVGYAAPASPSGWPVSAAAVFADFANGQPPLSFTWSGEVSYFGS